MKKAVSCILPFVPFISFGLAILFIVICTFMGDAPLEASMFLIILMLASSLIAVVSCYVIMILYMIKACKKTDLSAGMKVLWCFLLYFFNIFVFPVFWFIYLKNEY